jgi:acyl dehydratase
LIDLEAAGRKKRMDSTKLTLGEQFGPVESYCDPGEIAAFALAINDDNPMYQDGRAIPPTYAVVPGLQPFLATASTTILPPQALEGGRSAGHGEHDLYIHRQVPPGTVLYTSAQLNSIVVNKIGMNLVSRVTSVDDEGRLVFEQYWSTMMKGPVTGGDQGPEPADHAFPQEARSRHVATVDLATTPDQTFRYAGASGDRSGLHVDDRVANERLGGKQGKVLQGACTLGIASRALVAIAAGGDPRRITRLAVRFSRNVFPGDDISVSVYDVGATAGGGHAFAFEATVEGRMVLRNGRVEVSPS